MHLILFFYLFFLVTLCSANSSDEEESAIRKEREEAKRKETMVCPYPLLSISAHAALIFVYVFWNARSHTSHADILSSDTDMRDRTLDTFIVYPAGAPRGV